MQVKYNLYSRPVYAIEKLKLFKGFFGFVVKRLFLHLLFLRNPIYIRMIITRKIRPNYIWSNFIQIKIQRKELQKIKSFSTLHSIFTFNRFFWQQNERKIICGFLSVRECECSVVLLFFFNWFEWFSQAPVDDLTGVNAILQLAVIELNRATIFHL